MSGLESKLQSKILKQLESDKFVAIKIIQANKAGHADIIACSPEGRFWAIEVKAPGRTPDPLQLVRQKEYLANNAVAFWCDTWESFSAFYKTYFVEP